MVKEQQIQTLLRFNDQHFGEDALSEASQPESETYVFPVITAMKLNSMTESCLDVRLSESRQ